MTPAGTWNELDAAPLAAKAGLSGATATDNAVTDLFDRALARQQADELSAAADFYKKVLAIKPDHAAACERLGQIYLAQGKLDKASEQYAELARLVPQTLTQFDHVVEMLKRLVPTLAGELATVSGDAPRDAAGKASLPNLTERSPPIRISSVVLNRPLCGMSRSSDG